MVNEANWLMRTSCVNRQPKRTLHYMVNREKCEMDSDTVSAGSQIDEHGKITVDLANNPSNSRIRKDDCY